VSTPQTAQRTALTRRSALGAVVAIGAATALTRPGAAQAAADRPVSTQLAAALGQTAATGPGDIVFWHIRTSNLKVSLRFYRAMFGFAWEFQQVDAGTYVILIHGLPAGAMIGGQPRPRNSNTVLYITVDDLRANICKAERMGARVVLGPELIFPDLAFVSMVDATGNEFGMAGSYTEA
jgi:predicted enzyme related to lactoylglutathione lyase